MPSTGHHHCHHHSSSFNDRNADVIHVIENGRIIESGDWASLMARETGRSRRLCEAQDALQEADDTATVVDGLRGTHGASRARTSDPELTSNR